MAFTGRIGIDESQLGNIVLGIVDSFELSTIGFRAHVITPNKLRLIFDHAVTNSALNTAAYTFSVITPITTPVPVANLVSFDDPDHFVIIIEFVDVLCYQALYSVQVSGVVDLQGQGVTGTAQNFISNIQDPPIALRAFLSNRGYLDIKFNRSIGPYSNSATAEIRDSSLAPPGVALIPTTWASESIPEDTIRFIYPGVIPTADAYTIDFVNVLDVSGNYATSSIPLSLAFAGPYNSSSLAQIQFLDSYVVDVSRDLALGTVRVFFSGPVLDSSVTNQAVWNVEQIGPHLYGDTINQVSSPDAYDLPSSLILINEIKSKLNSHIIQDAVHQSFDLNNIITIINAVDLSTAISLYSGIKNNFNSHISKFFFHSYDDSLNLITSIPTEIISLMTDLNDFKLKFNKHLPEWKPLQFASGLPSEIGTIENHASESSAFEIESDISYFVDLHVVTHTSIPEIRCRATVLSEDGGSSTSTLNPTGDITARSGLSPAVMLENFIIPDDQVVMNFTRDLVFPTSGIEIRLPSGSDASVNFELTGTLPWLYRAFNFLVYAYSVHISPTGAGHIIPEGIAFVSPGDYCVATDLASLINKANAFRAKLTQHIQNSSSHYSLSGKPSFTESTDLHSLSLLIQQMQTAFLFHNSSGYSANTLYLFEIPPTNYGIHNYPGPNVLNSRTFNQISMRFRGMLDGNEHSIVGLLQDYKWDPRIAKFISSDIDVTKTFLGIAYRPSLASAVARTGLVRIEDGTEAGLLNLASDYVEVFFSKPMARVGLDASNFSIAGGSIVTNGRIWISPTQANFLVSSMDGGAYTISASSLQDEAGNLIY